jgi:galactose mutarotase-like enzyme
MDSPQVRTDPNGLPMHGLIHASYWEPVEVSSDADAVGARLDLGAHPELAAEFPFPHTMTVVATVRDSVLTIDATVEATGDAPVPLAHGFHPYFVLPGVPREQWHVEIPLTERLMLDDRMIPTGASETVEPFAGALGERTFDDGYAGATDGTTFALSGGGRRIEVELVSGYRYAQVYAPEGEETISFEPMTAPTDALRSGRGLDLVEPGERRTATFALSVTRA